MKIKFKESSERTNIYAHIYLDHFRVVEKYRCELYVRIIADYGDYIECEETRDDFIDRDASFYVSKDVIVMARIEDKN